MSAAILSMLVVLGGSFAGAAAVPQAWMSDQTHRQIVEQRLADQSIDGVKVAVSDRTVTLTGTVSTLWEKTHAREEAWDANTLGAVIDDVLVARSSTDQRLLDVVDRKIREFVFFTMFDDVEAAVTDGRITLTGSVTALVKAEEFADVVSRIPGVQDLVDRIRWAPRSPADKTLSYAIAARLYRHPLFRERAFARYPTIHILVRDGAVTLAGTVHSESERETAERIARETGGVCAFESSLRVEQDDSNW